MPLKPLSRISRMENLIPHEAFDPTPRTLLPHTPISTKCPLVRSPPDVRNQLRRKTAGVLQPTWPRMLCLQLSQADLMDRSFYSGIPSLRMPTTLNLASHTLRRYHTVRASFLVFGIVWGK